MNKTKILLLALAGLFVSSCVTDTVDDPKTSKETIASMKLLNTSENAVAGELIVYLNEQLADQLILGATRSTLTAFDTAVEELGATDVEPVFNLIVNAEQKRELGMHRWFTVKLPEQTDLDKAALRIAEAKEVERVEFATRITMPNPQVVEANAAQIGVTRSSELPYDDEMLYAQWHYNNDGTLTFPNTKAGADVNLFSAWEITAGRPDVIVAVVDEGVCHTHADLEPNMYINEAEAAGTEGVDDDGNGYVDDIYGYNFVDNGRITWTRRNDSGHGTHVAGTVAAVNNNGRGVAGVAGGTGKGDGVRLISCQIISNGEAAGVNATAKAVEYAADRGACILQNSWGFQAAAIANDANFENGSTGVELVAFRYFMQKENCPALKGGLIIFAAGNDGKAVAGYPAAYNELIAVTAIAPDGLPTYYTCYDRGCNIAAPGGEYYWANQSRTGEEGCVLSTIPGDKYGYMQGTSMACPHVSGIAALALSYALDLGKTFTLQQMKSILLTSVVDINAGLSGSKNHYENRGVFNLASYKNKMGTGLIDAYQVLMGVRGTRCIPVPVGEQVILDINNYIGDGKQTVKMLDEYIISQEDIERLGIEDIRTMGGKLLFTCTKPGSAMLTLTYVAGGTFVGGGQITGGLKAQHEFALIARPGVKVDSGTGAPIVPGGWL